jgi:hypothetical protein
VRYPPWPVAYALISPDFALPADPFQAVSITLNCPASVSLGVSWIGRRVAGRDASGPFLPLPNPGDEKSHTLAVQPYWQDFAVIRNLQIIVPPNTPFALDCVWISSPFPRDTAPSRVTTWGDPVALSGWRPVRGIRLARADADGLQIELSDEVGLLASPLLDAAASDIAWYGAALSGIGLRDVALCWACDNAEGLQGEDFGVPDDARHIYNSRLAGATGWRGNLKALALQFRGRIGTRVTLRGVGAGSPPFGGPDLRTLFFGALDPLPRAGKPLQLVWVGENDGGEAIPELSLQPEGPASPPARTLPRLDHGVPQIVTWDLGASGPGKLDFGLTLRSPAGATACMTASASITSSAPPAAAISLIPTKTTVAVTFRTPAPESWIEPDFDRRYRNRPVLGDYAGDDLAVWPWQIRWAAEHGISVFIFDVRARRNAPDPADLAALKAFLAADKPAQMRWCVRLILSRDTSDTAAVGLLKSLGERLSRPDYLRQDGRPVVFVSGVRSAGAHTSPRNLSGAAEVARSLGLPGLYLVACAPLQDLSPASLSAAGFSAVSDPDDEGVPSQAGPVEPLEASWRAAASVGIPVIPNLTAGFAAPDVSASPPSDLARLGFLCALALQQVSSVPPGSPRLIVVGSWNADGTRLPLEPRRGALFGPLDTVRRVFADEAAHVNAVPADVGLGPFDRKPLSPPSEWTFDTPGFDESWNMAMGFRTVDVVDGALRGTTTTDESALFGGQTRLDSRLFDTIRIRLCLNRGKRARLGWETNLQPLCSENSIAFAVQADGRTHEYVLRPGLMPGWRGLITGFRLDPTDVADATVALESLKVTHELN